MILADMVEWGLRPDGWLHVVLDNGEQPPFHVTRGPLGVLLYLVFVPFYAYVPARYRAGYLSATSLLLAGVTVGHPYMLTLATLVGLSLAVVRISGTHTRRRIGVIALLAGYTALLVYPQPFWLPPVDEPVYFYVHWAGFAYLFLKTLHVLLDVSSDKLQPPRTDEFLAFLLFAPALRMGPIYRYRDFHEQLQRDPREHRRIGAGVKRILLGFLRLAVIGVATHHFPLEVFFEKPGSFSTAEFLMLIYLAPLSFYLWMSAYMDLAIGIGRLMGFDVPENFNFPWRAVNISEFWQRWHITLGAWLGDYIFTPLVRRRWHYFISFTLTFLFCGIWHGPRWCYIIWGGAQGIGLGVRRFWSQYWKRKRKHSPLYARLEKLGLVNSKLPVVLAWALTFHYEIITIMIGMDFYFAGFRVFGHLFALVTGSPPS